VVSRSSNTAPRRPGNSRARPDAVPEEDEYERRGVRLYHNLLLAVKAVEVW
jgi:hypothetical protein